MAIQGFLSDHPPTAFTTSRLIETHQGDPIQSDLNISFGDAGDEGPEGHVHLNLVLHRKQQAGDNPRLSKVNVNQQLYVGL